jgi:hypothetical protein
MVRGLLAVLILAFSLSCADAQQLYNMPDLKSLKSLTSKAFTRGADNTTIDYYSSPDGTIVTVHSYRGRAIAFSAHSNNDIQGTYRVFLDTVGNGMFQEIDRGLQWTVPAWAK